MASFQKPDNTVALTRNWQLGTGNWELTYTPVLQRGDDMVQGAREAVMSYIKAMGDRDYAAARHYLGDNVRVKGPAGEAFRSPDEFLKMMEQQRGNYDIKKVFVDESDVCLLYDFVTPKVTTFFCSWYQVRDGKIISIQTVFDPRAFAAAQ